jgi:small subunit ribosomal protein S6
MAWKSAILSAVRLDRTADVQREVKHMSKKYEIMYILKPELEGDALKNENAALQKIITDNGGKVIDVNEWGLRDLAYAIKKETKGYYVVMKLEVSDTKANAEFDRLTRNNPNVLRYLITVAED